LANSKEQLLIEHLAAFGVTATGARIYLYLLGKPPTSILDISLELGLPRTSVYDNADKLAEKRLVEHVVYYKRHKLKAYPLSILQAHIDDESSRLRSLQAQLTVLEQDFTEASTQVRPNTEVRYYRGVTGLEQMVWNSLKTTGELVSYSQFSLTDVLGRHFIEHYNSELQDREIHSRVITNPENISSWQQSTTSIRAYTETLQECRILPHSKLRIHGDTTIYNNVFAVTNWEHDEIVGVEIENSDIAKVQKDIFNTMWTQSKPASVISPSPQNSLSV